MTEFAHAGHIRYPGRIGSKLVAIFVLFVALLLGGSGWVLYHLTRTALEDDLGDKLTAIAGIAAQEINPNLLMRLRPGDEDSRTYANLRRRLRHIQEATGARRLYAFDRQMGSLVDTETGVLIGRPYVKLNFDRTELARVWVGETAHSVLFEGTDGRMYKSGYAPVRSGDEVVAAIGVDIGATFLEAVRRFRRTVLLFAAVGIGVTVAIGFLFANTITRPIHRLVRAAGRIGRGDFAVEIRAVSRDELGYLSDALDAMRRNIIDRDNRLKTMLASIAHEIRNPLGGIEIFAGLLADKLEQDSAAREDAARIIQETRDLNRIITEFLDFARPKRPAKRSVPLDDLVDEALFPMLPEGEAKGVRFEIELPEGQYLHVDPDQTRRALLNLFKNAIQAMESGGRLLVRARRMDGGIVEIRIEDTGVGIPPEHMERLFEPFFTTREKGTGLGLAIVKKAVEENDGRITVETKPGEGTVFALLLPEGVPDADADRGTSDMIG